MKRIFISNPESGEPEYYFGDVGKELNPNGVRDFIQAEIENAIENDQSELFLRVSLKEMSDKEVDDLPDV